MFDLHRHLTSSSPLDDCFYATSRKEEWKAVIRAPYGAVGLLPSEPLRDVQEIYALLAAHPHLQIGEAGLDRRFPYPDKQEAFLRELLTIAVELDRSVTLHCVRREDRLLAILRSMDKLPRLLWHSFSGSYELACESARLGIVLSYGPRLKNAKLSGEGKRVTRFPFGLESDHEKPTEDRYEEAWQAHQRWFADLTGWSLDQLVRNNDEKRTILAH
jgi:TatD DNase family protein